MEKKTVTCEKNTVEIKPCGPFEALHMAERWLADHGYLTGSMQGPDPIGFALDAAYVAKWRNIPPNERKFLDGWIKPVHRFRDGGARIVFNKALLIAL